MNTLPGRDPLNPQDSVLPEGNPGQPEELGAPSFRHLSGERVGNHELQPEGSLQATGFSPYVKDAASERALAPEAYALGASGKLQKEIPEEHERPSPVEPKSEPLPPDSEPPLFQSWAQPEIHPPARIPHLGHLFILALLTIPALLGASLLIRSALYFHLYGVSTLQQAFTDIHYTLGSMAALYLFTFAAGILIFPLFWHKSFFAGLQWRGTTALKLRRRLFAAAFFCFVLALANALLMPGPENAPIDKLFRLPGAAWLMFAFGVTFAPFFEELTFRGFLLPALCTAWDWAIEQSTGKPALPLDENGHPQWSIFAMAIGSILTSIPFALMHAEQTAHALGPFLLLVCVSLVLCWARLSTRSLAASVLVHASYNFMLFALMLLGTGGFQHLDKM